MKIIQKRADQLQPGDIITSNHMRRRVVILTVLTGSGTVVHAMELGTTPAQWPAPSMPIVDPNDRMFNVEFFRADVRAVVRLDALLATARVVVGLIDSGEVLTDAASKAHDVYQRAREAGLV